MQISREEYGNRVVTTQITGVESSKLLEQFRAQRDAVQKRLESGETEKATITEHRRIGRNDDCPCGSKEKFKKCCGKRLAANDERIAEGGEA